MNIDTIEKSFINRIPLSYKFEFMNWAKFESSEIFFGETIDSSMNTNEHCLNNLCLQEYKNVIYIFEYKGVYGILCDVPIEEYNNGNIKPHEIVIENIVENMTKKLKEYNCESDPVLLVHQKKFNYTYYIGKNKYSECLKFNDLKIYVFHNREAKEIIDEFTKIDKFYIADGHHRLYATSLNNFKSSILSCLVSLEDLNILPIHRFLLNIDKQNFAKAKEFIYNNFKILSSDTELSKSKIKIKYDNDSFVVVLNDIYNNDFSEVNEQIISKAFEIDDTSIIKYLSDYELENKLEYMNKNNVLIQMSPMLKGEFIECMNNGDILPPKSTWFYPKFPSFIVFKQYR